MRMYLLTRGTESENIFFNISVKRMSSAKCCPPIITNPCIAVANDCELPFITPPVQQKNLCLKVRLPNCGNPCPPKDCCDEVVPFDWSWLMWDLPAGTVNAPYCSEMGRTCTNHCCPEPEKRCCKKMDTCKGYEQKCTDGTHVPDCKCGGKKKQQ